MSLIALKKERSMLGYIVSAPAEGGYLYERSPALWHWEYAGALRYPTIKKAREVAKRQNTYTEIEILYELSDGSYETEQQTGTTEEQQGGYIIKVSWKTKPYYVVSSGKKVRITTEIEDAKAYKTAKNAEKVIEILNGTDSMSAEIIQITADIIAIR